MSTLHSRKNNIEIMKKELMGVLKEKYDIEVEIIKKNSQSTDNNVYEIFCHKNKYIVKLYNSITHTNSMIKLYTKLSSSGINVPKIIYTKEQEGYIQILEKFYIIVYSFIDGKEILWNEQNGKFDKEIIASIAGELRRLHKIMNNEFNLPILPFENKTPRKSVLHFDLTRHNIFENLDKTISFIDFDDAKYGDSVCDIAILITNLFFSKTRGVDIEGMKTFLNNYYIDDMELKSKEESLIKTYALKWIKYILDGNQFDTSTTESFKVKYKLINEYLKER